MFSQYLSNIYHSKIASKTTSQPIWMERKPLAMHRRETAHTSTPCRLVLEWHHPALNMDVVGHEVKTWVAEAFGEKPLEISLWAQEDDFVQLFVKLSDRVVILSLSNDEGEIIEDDSLIIREGQWQPKSIQTRRMPDGFVRFKHRSKEILLAPELSKSPDWASSLLEGWLSEIRGDSGIPKTRSQRISTLLRSRDRIEKMLDQANLEEIIDEVRYVELRLDSADYKLAGPEYAYSSSEE